MGDNSFNIYMMFDHFLMVTSALVCCSGLYLFAQLKKNFLFLSSVLTIQQLNVGFDKIKKFLILNWTPFI
jgi:hypothetical protein